MPLPITPPVQPRTPSMPPPLQSPMQPSLKPAALAHQATTAATQSFPMAPAAAPAAAGGGGSTELDEALKSGHGPHLVEEEEEPLKDITLQPIWTVARGRRRPRVSPPRRAGERV